MKDSLLQKLARTVTPSHAATATEFRVGCDDEAQPENLLPAGFSRRGPYDGASSDAGMGASVPHRKGISKGTDTCRTEVETNQLNELSYRVADSDINRAPLGSGEAAVSPDPISWNISLIESISSAGKKKKASDAKMKKKTKVEWAKNVFVLPASESFPTSSQAQTREFQVQLSSGCQDASQAHPREFQAQMSKGSVDASKAQPHESQIQMSKGSVVALQAQSREFQVQMPSGSAGVSQAQSREFQIQRSKASDDALLQVPLRESHASMTTGSAGTLQPVSVSYLNPGRQITPSRRQSCRIDNKGELTKRWHWNQELVAKEFLPYKKMLAEGDDLIPTPNELDSFQNVLENQHLEKVLTAMLDDGELHEREIAAFFEGLALYDIKVKALQSQAGFLKAEREAENSGTLAANPFHRIRSRQPVNYSHTRHMSYTPSAKNQVVPAAMSVRALSIRKIKNENKGDGEVQKLLAELEEAEKKQRKLEQQLRQAGIVIAEDIPYEEARAHVERIFTRMQEIGSSDVNHDDKELGKRLREEYFRLEQEMEKYSAALEMSDEYAEIQERLEQKWDADNVVENMEALKKVRRCIPVNVKFLSEAQLRDEETPNGRFLPEKMAKKFKRTNVLQLLRTSPDDITRMHPSTLASLRVTGLTLTERRAIYAHLQSVGPVWKAMRAEPMAERKWAWYEMMTQNFKENLSTYQRHVEQYGPPGSHVYATHQNQSEGCPLLGNQCPLRANKVIDYDDDYGYTEDAEYEVLHVKQADPEEPGAKAMREACELLREKKSSQRSESLKRHYKGKVIQVSLASGSCESMDEIMDRMEFLRQFWMEESLSSEGDVTDDLRRERMSNYGNAINELKLTLLRLAGRSGIQLTGKKDSNADQEDPRSLIELGLAEEVCESCIDFFQDIQHLMSEMKAKDLSRIKSTIGLLRELLDEFHERNVATCKALGVERPERSRKLKSRAEIKREVAKIMRAKRDRIGSSSSGEGSVRGSLVESGGGCGGEVERSRGKVTPALSGCGRGGRGNLMSAIAGRGRGGRGDLMSAIAGRGQGGRGDLMSAIAGRGQGGRGGLMSAITGRGREDAGT